MPLESQRKANKKYASKNREKLNNYMKERYKKMKETDPEKWRKYVDSRIEYRKKKKEQTENNENINNQNEISSSEE